MKPLIDRLQIAQGNNNADELIPEVIEMLCQQQAEIEVLKAKLKQYHLKEDLDRNLNLIYGKEFVK